MYKLDINLPDKSYPIIIEKDLFVSIDSFLTQYIKGNKVVVLTDENLSNIYGTKLQDMLNNLNSEVCFIVLKAGEETKSLAVLERVYSELLSFGITKSDYLIAFGGGVIGDLTGFAAATYLRGIPFIQIPTSLLAQVDSSIGGKTAVNLPQGKNLIGSFYHPEAVFIDPQLLSTLHPRYFADGMAEVIKYGCIKDTELFEILENIDITDQMQHMEKIVYKCCNIKKLIVEEDEKDNGSRMLLNFGHTFGHAIEKIFCYEKYTHGEGVAIGMHHITKKSEEMGLTEINTSERIKGLLGKYNLPFSFPHIDEKSLLDAVAPDKKSRGRMLNLILLKKIGSGFIHTIDKNDTINYI